MESIFNDPRLKSVRRLLRNRPTNAEKQLWYMLKNDPQGVRFRRQHGIGPYVVDFYCPLISLVIEVDGDSHFQDGAEKKDAARQEYLENLRLHVLRFTDLEIREGMESVLERIKDTIIRLKEEIDNENSP